MHDHMNVKFVMVEVKEITFADTSLLQYKITC